MSQDNDDQLQIMIEHVPLTDLSPDNSLPYEMNIGVTRVCFNQAGIDVSFSDSMGWRKGFAIITFVASLNRGKDAVLVQCLTCQKRCPKLNVVASPQNQSQLAEKKHH